MRNFLLALGAAAVAIPTAAVVPIDLGTTSVFSYGKADAQRRHRYKYREWRGRDGRVYCRKSDGTTGLVIGGVAGALVGRSIDTGGDRTLGTLLGAGAGALAGREIDRSSSKSKRRCR